MLLPACFGWCATKDRGDCYIKIRTGGNEASVDQSYARGVMFMHSRNMAHNQEVPFAHISGVPHETEDESELQFAVGSDKINALLYGNGLLSVHRIVVGSSDDCKVSKEEFNSQFALQVTSGGIKIAAQSPKETREIRFDDFQGKKQASISIDTESQFILESANDIRILGSGDESIINVQGSLFRNNVPNIETASLKATNIQFKDNGWSVEQDLSDSLAFVFSDKPVVKISGDSPRDTIVVDESGNIGVGTRWPTVKLDVNGGIQGTSAYSSASDLRYKQNVRAVSTTEDTLKNLSQLRGVRFQFKVDEFPEKDFEKGEQIGFIAQEVERVYPELVRTGRTGFKSVMYGSFAPLLVEAIKDLETMIREQNEKIETLQNHVLQLK